MFDERETVSSVRNGDMRAFELLIKQYERLVFSIISRLVDHGNDTEDIAQEVFIKIYNGLERFAFQSKLSTWVASITYHTALNYIRDHKKHTTSGAAGMQDGMYFTTETPARLSEQKEINRYVHQLIGEMPVAYKTVLTLYHLHEMSYEEIGKITGMPEGTVKNYLFRARKILKEQLKKCLE
ncbi:RNA polymerase sigma factor [Niabella beijingensis]|uniref:RNA polymerase sigma factor n=1 Tax=Niabella beijingensis TaxID=2872700 RepID=UPI001CBB0469|nr:sigma-70 family RNA polymerase sigma factor [Niabella beijingensis]MBZ4189474.1 sigma-70 family RNA polymerase sigma factor [Niabella beijingensis]